MLKLYNITFAGKGRVPLLRNVRLTTDECFNVLTLFDIMLRVGSAIIISTGR